MKQRGRNREARESRGGFSLLVASPNRLALVFFLFFIFPLSFSLSLSLSLFPSY